MNNVGLLPLNHHASVPESFRASLDCQAVTDEILCQNAELVKLGFKNVARCELLRFKTNKRFLVKYECEMVEGRNLFILGKSRIKSLDKVTAQVTETLREHGFCEPQNCVVPKSFGAIPRWNMNLQLFVNAAPLLPSDERFVAWQSRLGTELGRLQQVNRRANLIVGKRHTYSKELEILENRYHKLVKLLPNLRQVIYEIFSRCVAIELYVDSVQSLIHRDFYFDQVLLSDSGSLIVVDWDLAAMGDPLLDAGNYSAHLIEFGMRNPLYKDRCELGRNEFLVGYREQNRDVPRFSDALRAWEYISVARHLSLATEISGRSHTISRLIQWLKSPQT